MPVRASETFACPRCGRNCLRTVGAPSRYDGKTPICAHCVLLETIWVMNFGSLPFVWVDLLEPPREWFE